MRHPPGARRFGSSGRSISRWHDAEDADARLGVLCYNSPAWNDEEERDQGTYLRTCAQGLVRFGRAPDRLWPFDVARVNTRPSWKAYRAAFELRGPRGYYRIANGDLAVVRIALAPAQHSPDSRRAPLPGSLAGCEGATWSG